MRLNYKEASSNLPDEQTDTRGYAILRTDSNQVGEIVRLQNTLEPVNDNELVIRYKIINRRLFLGAESSSLKKDRILFIKKPYMAD